MIRALLFTLALPLSVLAQGRTPPRTVIIFGDSITSGGSWVKQVEKESSGTLILINEGKGGRPTNSVKEFEAMLSRHPQADALAIALGMNDSRDITDACTPKALANLRVMIEKARAAYGVKLSVLLVGPTNINKAALGPTKSIGDQREAKLRELGDAFAKLAIETHSEFISLYGVVPDAALLKDGVHPDEAGNDAIAKAMSKRMKSWLVD
jgi:acyl-CoA thioesterase-1